MNCVWLNFLHVWPGTFLHSCNLSLRLPVRINTKQDELLYYMYYMRITNGSWLRWHSLPLCNSYTVLQHAFHFYHTWGSVWLRCKIECGDNCNGCRLWYHCCWFPAVSELSSFQSRYWVHMKARQLTQQRCTRPFYNADVVDAFSYFIQVCFTCRTVTRARRHAPGYACGPLCRQICFENFRSPHTNNFHWMIHVTSTPDLRVQCRYNWLCSFKNVTVHAVICLQFKCDTVRRSAVCTFSST